MINREEIKEQLNQNVVQVTFTKVDGTERVMNATLKTELIPDYKPKKILLDFGFIQEEMAELLKTYSEPANQPVWDLDKKAWRSFRWDSVKETKVLNG